MKHLDRASALESMFDRSINPDTYDALAATYRRRAALASAPHLALSLPLLAPFEDSTTRALDRLAAAAEFRKNIAVRIALITLIPAIIFFGITGASIILAHW